MLYTNSRVFAQTSMLYKKNFMIFCSSISTTVIYLGGMQWVHCTHVNSVFLEVYISSERLPECIFTSLFFHRRHMTVMAFQIIGNATVCSIPYVAQTHMNETLKVSDAEQVSMQWRHHVFMVKVLNYCLLNKQLANKS